MKKFLNKAVVAFLCLACMMLVMPLNNAQAMTLGVNNSAGLSVDETPRFLGGKLSGVKTQMEVVEGMGTVTASINYDTGEMVLTKPDGTVHVTDFHTVASQLAQAIESMTPEQRAYVTNVARQRGAHTTECKTALAVIGAIHGGAWGSATALLTANPALGWLVGAGNAALFEWFKSYC